MSAFGSKADIFGGKADDTQSPDLLLCRQVGARVSFFFQHRWLRLKSAGDLVLPEAFEAIRRQSRVTDGRVDRLVRTSWPGRGNDEESTR
jgi:hypothetical protein